MNVLKKMSQATFFLGGLFAVGSVAYTFYLRQTSPPGFCPINPVKPLMWIGIAMLVASLIIDGWMGYKNKKIKN